jgi:hypothetical protein
MPSVKSGFQTSLVSLCGSLFSQPRRRKVLAMSAASEVCEERRVPTALGNAPTATLVYKDDIIVLGNVADDSNGGNTMEVNVDIWNDGIVDDVVYCEYDSFTEEYYFNYPVAQFLGTPVDIDIKFTPVESNGSGSQTGTPFTVTVEAE